MTGIEFVLVIVLVFEAEYQRFEFRRDTMAQCVYLRDLIIAGWVNRPYPKMLLLGDCRPTQGKKKTR